MVPIYAINAVSKKINTKFVVHVLHHLCKCDILTN